MSSSRIFYQCYDRTSRTSSNKFRTTKKRPKRSDYRCGSRFEHLFERHKQKLFRQNYLFFRLFILYSNNSHRFLTITWSWVVNISQFNLQAKLKAVFYLRVGTGWNWLELVGTGWNWLELVGTGWNWLELIGADWSWLKPFWTNSNILECSRVKNLLMPWYL